MQNHPVLKIDLHPTSRGGAFDAGRHPGVQLIGAVLGGEPLHQLGGTRGAAGRNSGGLEDGATPLHHPISA